jgi:hypothetical protein
VRTSPKSTGKNRGGIARGVGAGGGATGAGAFDRGTMPGMLRKVKRISSDTRGSNSVCSGERLGFSTIEYCTCDERKSARKAERVGAYPNGAS